MELATGPEDVPGAGGGQQGLQPCKVGGDCGQGGQVALKTEAPLLFQEVLGLHCGSEAAVGKRELLSPKSVHSTDVWP